MPQPSRSFPSVPPRRRACPLTVPLLLLGVLPARGGAHEADRLDVPDGFHAHPGLRFPTNRFLGGLALLADGGALVYDGVSVAIHESGGAEPRVMFTPPDPPAFGSFVRIDLRGESAYLGVTRQGDAPHQIYRIPLDPGPGEETETLDAIRYNYDLAFDDRGRGFVSALEVTSENRIYLLDRDPEAPSDAVVTGIPIYSGPVAFRDGKLYYATADPNGGNRVVYFTLAQLDEGIGEGKAIDFVAATGNQVVAEVPGSGHFNLVLVGNDLLASDSLGGRIDRIVLEGERAGTVEPFASLLLPGGGSGSVTFLALRPGPREFRSGAGSAGGSLFAAITDFTAFNDVVEITPELHFRRGYINADPDLDLSDAVALLEHLFLGGAPPDPREAGDLNDDGGADLSDAIYLLAYLFTGGPEPPVPFRASGPDPTP